VRSQSLGRKKDVTKNWMAGITPRRWKSIRLWSSAWSLAIASAITLLNRAASSASVLQVRSEVLGSSTLPLIAVISVVMMISFLS